MIRRILVLWIGLGFEHTAFGECFGYYGGVFLRACANILQFVFCSLPPLFYLFIRCKSITPHVLSLTLISLFLSCLATLTSLPVTFAVMIQIRLFFDDNIA